MASNEYYCGSVGRIPVYVCNTVGNGAVALPYYTDPNLYGTSQMQDSGHICTSVEVETKYVPYKNRGGDIQIDVSESERLIDANSVDQVVEKRCIDRSHSRVCFIVGPLMGVAGLIMLITIIMTSR